MPRPLHLFKAELFKALAHPTRIHILELLRTGEMSVNEIQQRLGIEASTASQQLAVLRTRSVVSTRKAGTTVYYRTNFREVYGALDAARAIFDNHLAELNSVLRQQLDEERAAAESRK
jgi:ArsR family transcriptional regulator